MRFGKLIFQRITLFGQPVYYRSARISQSHHLCAFVKCFSHRIIDGLSEYLILQRTVHPYYLRVTAGHKKTQIRKLRLTVVRSLLLYEICQNMSLKMIDFHKRFVKRQGQSLCKGSTHKERAEKSRTARKYYCRDLIRPDAGARDGFTHNRNDIYLMRS